MARSWRGKLPESEGLYAFDAAWTVERTGPLAGADEAGRGALAGPLVAAAVVLGKEQIPGIRDSKVLTAGLREEAYLGIMRCARAVSVVAYPAWWIDRHGVGAANRNALARALEALEPFSGCSLADGNLKLGEDIECLPKADGSSASVAAASVVAKVLRDAAMETLAGKHGGYGFERNRGYGTATHKLALADLGPCRVHRLSYAGVVV